MRAERRPAVVVDTNVWISAALSQSGAPAKLVAQVLAHALPVFCEATFEELHSRLWKAKFDRYLTIEARNRAVDTVLAAARWVDISAERLATTYCRDPDDDVFIHVARTADAGWLITGDNDLLCVPPIPGLQIVTPGQALALRAIQPAA